uniref:NADH-ubiquinone oxidoreductase chain 6 n=1 Tax=Xyletinus sp. XYL01 TaxID=1227479 RepID=S4SVC3_9COLE|nr:NADH dehydrogenase subunit 6 [Xyletinus sp. XYL01]
MLCILFILSMIMMFSLFFISLNHPLITVLILILMSTLISLFTGILVNSFWFSYMLFLIMVGGMLVVFIYMTSVASNEKISINYKFLILSLLFSPLILVFNIFMKNLMNNSSNMILKSQESMMIKFMIFPYFMMMMMMIIYLLITLIATVKITRLNMGPLRQKY